MSYGPIDTPESAAEQLKRKEFYSLRAEAVKPSYRDVPDPFAGKYLKMHSAQLFAKNLMNPNTPYKRIHLTHATGCHPAGTFVLLHHGEARAVEDIGRGDLLMGDDGTPRRVLATLQGRQRMYAIRAAIGGVCAGMTDAFSCNKDHILTVAPMCATSSTGSLRAVSLRSNLLHAALVDISLREYLRNTYKYTNYGLVRRRGDALEGPFPFAVTRLDVDTYYGFELDGNRRYVLANGFVTHNTGKTLASVAIAMEFIKLYRQIYEQQAMQDPSARRNWYELEISTPNVFVLGFGGPKAAFIRELLQYPEFGFISVDEKTELYRLRRLAEVGLPADIKNYKDFYAMIKRRITTKSKGGFIKFYGYDEFVNRIFISDSVKLVDLEAQAIKSAKDAKDGEGAKTVEDLIKEHIAAGTIQVNPALLASFKDSLVICDEIHNTYNTNMKNNRGVAIQYVLDNVDSVRFVSLSATPLNNSPAECVDLINYLVPKEEKLARRDLFANGGRKLLPGALERIGRATLGKISFWQDSDIKYYPQSIYVGESIVLKSATERMSAGQELPYLKFTPCPMSEEHQAAYIQHAATVGAPHSVSADGYAIYDMIYPSPASNGGIYRASEIGKIYTAPQEWRDKMNIIANRNPNSLGGPWLERQSLDRWSTKLATMWDTIRDIVARAAGNPEQTEKVMIYHNRIESSGVMQIAEVLRANGCVDEHSEPVDMTRCVVCFKTRADHGDSVGSTVGSAHKHDFVPMRFIMAHSNIDNATIAASLEKYNAPMNAHGHHYMILLGSKKIKESYDFKDIQNLIIMSTPTNIPTMMQIFGRCIRKGSHNALPPESRRVFIHILVSTINPAYPAPDATSPELYRYAEKLCDYLEIQKIERTMNSGAIDADIHRGTTMSRDLMETYFPGKGLGPRDSTAGLEPVPKLGNLYFDPAIVVAEIQPGDVKLSTFNSGGHNEGEIRQLMFLIKKCFLDAPVWTYETLWCAVRRPPIGVENNPVLFSEHNFIIALHGLIEQRPEILSYAKTREMTEARLISRMLDPADRYIMRGGVNHRIAHVGKYYILSPVVARADTPINARIAEYYEKARDKERIMIKELTEPNLAMVVDIDACYRAAMADMGRVVDLGLYVEKSKQLSNYQALRDEFLARRAAVDPRAFLSHYPESFAIRFCEEMIADGWASANDHPRWAWDKSGEEPTAGIKSVIELLDSLRVLVWTDEVAKYKDVAKHFTATVLGGQRQVVGFMVSRAVRLYHPDKGEWFDVSKLALNRQVDFRENDIIVGYFESVEDKMRFKLRKPKHKILREVKPETAKTVRAGDLRLIEYGIVCTTKSKHELRHIAADLGISSSTMGKAELKKVGLCRTIMNRLLDKEAKERRADTRGKWVYGWWDELPPLA